MNESIIENIKAAIIQTVGDSISSELIDEDYKLAGNILDSMSVASLIIALEEQFNFYFDDDELSAESFETIGTLVQLIKRKINQ